MLKPDVVAQAQQLLAEGRLSQRAIAKLLRISRWSITRIARGTRPDYEAIRLQKAAEASTPAGPTGRCPQCGRLTQSPCLACQVQARATLPTREGDDQHGPIQIELVGSQRERYREIQGQHLQEETVYGTP